MDSHMSNDTSDPARASSRIYVGNLKKHIEREDLQKLFSKYGEIQGISLHKGGFGFVQFKEEGEAEAAVKGEGGVFFKGCLLQLRVCSSQDSRRSFRGGSRERDREYSDHDRRHESGMPRDRSPVHRDYDEREFKREDRAPPGKPYDRSPPRRGDDYSSDRRFGRDEGRHGRDAPPFRGDDYSRGGPPAGPPPPRDRYSREDRYGGRDERGYGRDDPHRPYPRPEGNGRFGRDGYWGGRDEFGVHHGRDEPPMGFGRDEQPPPRSRMDPVPVPPPFRPEGDLRKPNDCEIIVLHRQNRNYAEMVERRLKNLGMQVDLLFLKDQALLSRALEDLTQRGTLFAVVVTDQHEVHGSVTVNILYGVPQVERAKQEADRMHEAGDHEASYKMLLQYKDCGDPELLWRLARVTFKRCENAPKAEREAGLAEGITYLDKAVECGGDKLGPVHKWYSILIGSKKDHPSTKERIQDGFLIKKHVQKAIELMPQDPLNYYVLGNWCYEVAGTPWIIRKAGQLIFSEIPSSTYEEALQHFQKAEKIKPHFYRRNLLMIAKTLLELNRKEEAVTYLKDCVDIPTKATEDDKKVSEEAQQSLKKLGMS
ncbi:uncharacterized protein LOC119406870 isoform X4 [Rhipicephalus sanguineus]|uniref:uncharacterized protein LOC119406870 isoform X4 n=1 Tax=Rhipicephalus sanguineus TaxID=34632 RepID=UPI0018958DA5|nr:uncharacterized protein LOC119406870 isoform X4 [Rhipicephalus sanguineus]